MCAARGEAVPETRRAGRPSVREAPPGGRGCGEMPKFRERARDTVQM